MEKIRLINGKYRDAEAFTPSKIPSQGCWSVTLSEVTFGDVTQDGIEDAIVILYAELGGTESTQDVFVFGFRGKKIVLLWKFKTGDHADGGLRGIYAERGDLVIELFGVDTEIGGRLDNTEDVPDCCPAHYTRRKYKWLGNKFHQTGKQVVLPIP